MKDKRIDEKKWEPLVKHLKNKRLTMSQNRSLLYDYLFTMPDSLTMIEIYEKVQGHGIKISFSTVYRAVKLFCEAKLLRSIILDDGVSRYIHASSQNSISFMCQRCKSITFAHENIKSLITPRDFTNCKITQTQITYIGLCSRCIK